MAELVVVVVVVARALVMAVAVAVAVVLRRQKSFYSVPYVPCSVQLTLYSNSMTRARPNQAATTNGQSAQPLSFVLVVATVLLSSYLE